MRQLNPAAWKFGSCAATPRIVSAVVELPFPQLLGSFPSLEKSIPGAQSRIFVRCTLRRSDLGGPDELKVE